MAKVYRLCNKGKITGQRNLCLDEGAGYTPLLYPVSMSVIQRLAGLFTKKENSREKHAGRCQKRNIVQPITDHMSCIRILSRLKKAIRLLPGSSVILVIPEV